MIARFFRPRGDAPALPAERGPLAVAIRGAIAIDTLSLQADTAAASPSMPLPNLATMIVAAFGEVRLDATTVLSRYYDDDHGVLQVMSASGKAGDEITDVSFYQAWDSVVPAGSSEWDRWTGARGLIGQPRYDADGIVFSRYWSEGEERADLVEFVEDVDDGETSRAIHQSCMLYSRPLGHTVEMLLINVERDLDQGHARQGGSIEFLIGYGFSPADVRRV
ncbi:MAG: DUF2491 family protein [Rhizobiales bacterium]|nr:DUF2491 family protein [Hyphomicrobiales bacterium]